MSSWARWLVDIVEAGRTRELPAEFSRRGSRYPAGAHTVAVALRVDCAVVLGLGSAPRNSLCSLRSRRSDNRGESVDEVRCAHRPQPCAPRRHRDRSRRVPTSASEVIGFSGQQEFRVPTPRRNLAWYSAQTETTLQQRCVRVGCGAPLQRRGAQLSRLRAQRAWSTFSSRLSERRERSERSEFRDAAVKARTTGQSKRSADRCSEAPQPTRARLCREHYRKQKEDSVSARVSARNSQQPLKTVSRPGRDAPAHLRWSN
jgi:hypothetical protein